MGNPFPVKNWEPFPARERKGHSTGISRLSIPHREKGGHFPHRTSISFPRGTVMPFHTDSRWPISYGEYGTHSLWELRAHSLWCTRNNRNLASFVWQLGRIRYTLWVKPHLSHSCSYTNTKHCDECMYIVQIWRSNRIQTECCKQREIVRNSWRRLEIERKYLWLPRGGSVCKVVR